MKYFYFSIQHSEAVVQMCSVKKVFLEISHLYQSLFFNKLAGLRPESFFNKVAGLRPATLFKKSLAQVFSCEFCGISKNTFSYRAPPVAASEHSLRMFLINRKIEFTEKSSIKI